MGFQENAVYRDSIQLEVIAEEREKERERKRRTDGVHFGYFIGTVVWNVVQTVTPQYH